MTTHLGVWRDFTNKFLRDSAVDLYKANDVLEVGPEDAGSLAPALWPHARVHLMDKMHYEGITVIGDLTQPYALPRRVADVVIAINVLEHTKDPFTAAEGLWMLTKACGVVLVATPLNIGTHYPDPDAWRFMAAGLQILFNSRWWRLRSMTECSTVDRPGFPVGYTLIAEAK